MKIQSRLGVTIEGASSSHVAVTVNDGDTVNFTASGTDNQTITAEVVIDPAVDNITVATVDGVYTKLIDEVTYAELAALISGSDLIQGRQYLITDYQTVHTIPTTAVTNTGPTEPLIVTAISTNELAPIAYSTLYPDDIIYYTTSNGSVSFPGSTKGYIYRRIDTVQNNDIGTDWRHVKYRRYKVNQAVWDAGTTYSIGSAVKSTVNNNIYLSLQDSNLNNIVTDTDYWVLFPYQNGEYRGLTGTSWVINPFTTITTDAIDFTDYPLFTSYSSVHTNNIIRTYELMNTVSTSQFRYNIIEGGFKDNTILGFFQYNNINFTFEKNVIGANFDSNVIMNTLSENIICGTFSANNIQTRFVENIVGTRFNKNRIGHDFERNSVGTDMEFNNIFSGFFEDNIILNFFRYNNIYSQVDTTDFTSATHVYSLYGTEIFRRLDNTNRLRYTDNTDTIIYSAITA